MWAHVREPLPLPKPRPVIKEAISISLVGFSLLRLLKSLHFPLIQWVCFQRVAVLLITCILLGYQLGDWASVLNVFLRPYGESFGTIETQTLWLLVTMLVLSVITEQITVSRINVRFENKDIFICRGTFSDLVNNLSVWDDFFLSCLPSLINTHLYFNFTDLCTSLLFKSFTVVLGSSRNVCASKHQQSVVGVLEGAFDCKDGYALVNLWFWYQVVVSSLCLHFPILFFKKKRVKESWAY